MKLPRFTRLQRDITNQTERFILVLNRWFENINNVLRNLTFEDNFRARFYSVTFDGTLPLSLEWGLPTPPAHLLVTGATGGTASALPLIDWEFTGSTINVTGVTGLTATAAAPATLTFFILGD